MTSAARPSPHPRPRDPAETGPADPALAAAAAADTDAADPALADPTAADAALADTGATDAGPAVPALALAAAAAGNAAPAPPSPEGRFLNRELSWLDFNARVLALAEDPTNPLLERAKYIAIFASNLDEFYMVRVAGLKRRLQTGLPVRSPDGMSLREQLECIGEQAATLVGRQARCFTDTVLPALRAQGVQLVCWEDLGPAEREQLRGYFREQVFPVLTPLAVDPAHPFPYISGLSLNLAVVVRDPGSDNEFFARVKVPNNVPRLVPLERDRSSKAARFLPVEELIAAHLGQLFSGMTVVEQHLFRVTRNAEVELDEDRDEDLLQALERELARRRFGPPVRLEVAASISDRVLDTLVRELDMDTHDVLRVPGLLDLSALWQVYEGVDRPDLKDQPFVPATHPYFAEGETPRSVFARLRDHDILVHHPYHSFSTSVQRFIEQAAADPNVLAIKQTLYRTSGDSPIVDALIDAAEAGKQVVVLVEVKARFDEQANIGWARMLERAGCHVVYGLVGLKTHCKTALVVRQEGNHIRRYCHIGTGNYHPKTARLYEDFGLLTADPEVGADLTDLFNVLTGYSRQTAYRRLLVAPHGVRTGIIERIEQQIERVRSGGRGLVQVKVNSLVDEQIVDALYRASQAGVRVDLVVRGICTLRPGVPGLSDNIVVRSILGRFLEHSRIFRFGCADTDSGRVEADPGLSTHPPVPAGGAQPGGDPLAAAVAARSDDAEFWIGSADLMHRNLDRRVEALVRVTDPLAQAEIDAVMSLAMSDRISSFELAADGSWRRRTAAGADPAATDGAAPLIDFQDTLLRRISSRSD